MPSFKHVYAEYKLRHGMHSYTVVFRYRHGRPYDISVTKNGQPCHWYDNTDERYRASVEHAELIVNDVCSITSGSN